MKKRQITLPDHVVCSICGEGIGWTSPILASVWEEAIEAFLKNHKHEEGGR